MSAPLTTRRIVVRLPRPTDLSFPALGSTVRLIAAGPEAGAAVARARADVLDYHARLSRFLPDSELSALNEDPRRAVPASALLCDAVRAGLWAAQFSGGLVDPGLLDALEAAGYERSYEPPDDAVLPAGALRAARPDPSARWTQIRVLNGAIVRPPGLRLDLGGTGKGHIADRLTRRFEAQCGWVVDCGGDVRVGGTRRVQVAHPLRIEPAADLTVTDCAVATSSVASRAWVSAGGDPVHHLLDPSTGRPVRTGLLSATAIASTTLHAETLAKMALMSGARRARELLAPCGGVLIHEDGTVEEIHSAREEEA